MATNLRLTYFYIVYGLGGGFSIKIIFIFEYYNILIFKKRSLHVNCCCCFYPVDGIRCFSGCIFLFT